jgi:iron(III) transport system permease protein
MVIAWLVVRKNFSGKEALDFSSNLGGAVPGTILGIGFILVFNKPPLALAVVIYAVLALFFVLVVGKDARERLVILLVGTAAGVLLTRLELTRIYYFLGGLYLFLGVFLFLSRKKPWPCYPLLGVCDEHNWTE